MKVRCTFQEIFFFKLKNFQNHWWGRRRPRPQPQEGQPRPALALIPHGIVWLQLGGRIIEKELKGWELQRRGEQFVNGDIAHAHVGGVAVVVEADIEGRAFGISGFRWSKNTDQKRLHSQMKLDIFWILFKCRFDQWSLARFRNFLTDKEAIGWALNNDKSHCPVNRAPDIALGTGISQSPGGVWIIVFN